MSKVVPNFQPEFIRPDDKLARKKKAPRQGRKKVSRFLLKLVQCRLHLTPPRKSARKLSKLSSTGDILLRKEDDYSDNLVGKISFSDDILRGITSTCDGQFFSKVRHVEPWNRVGIIVELDLGAGDGVDKYLLECGLRGVEITKLATVLHVCILERRECALRKFQNYFGRMRDDMVVSLRKMALRSSQRKLLWSTHPGIVSGAAKRGLLKAAETQSKLKAGALLSKTNSLKSNRGGGKEGRGGTSADPGLTCDDMLGDVIQVTAPVPASNTELFPLPLALAVAPAAAMPPSELDSLNDRGGARPNTSGAMLESGLNLNAFGFEGAADVPLESNNPLLNPLDEGGVQVAQWAPAADAPVEGAQPRENNRDDKKTIDANTDDKDRNNDSGDIDMRRQQQDAADSIPPPQGEVTTEEERELLLGGDSPIVTNAMTTASDEPAVNRPLGATADGPGQLLIGGDGGAVLNDTSGINGLSQAFGFSDAVPASDSSNNDNGATMQSNPVDFKCEQKKAGTLGTELEVVDEVEAEVEIGLDPEVLKEKERVDRERALKEAEEARLKALELARLEELRLEELREVENDQAFLQELIRRIRLACLQQSEESIIHAAKVFAQLDMMREGKLEIEFARETLFKLAEDKGLTKGMERAFQKIDMNNDGNVSMVSTQQYTLSHTAIYYTYVHDTVTAFVPPPVITRALQYILIVVERWLL
jgi:hypothetical protein